MRLVFDSMLHLIDKKCIFFVLNFDKNTLSHTLIAGKDTMLEHFRLATVMRVASISTNVLII